MSLMRGFGKPLPPLNRIFLGTLSFTADQLLLQAESNFALEREYYCDSPLADPRRIAYVSSTFGGRALAWYTHLYQLSPERKYEHGYAGFQRDLLNMFGSERWRVDHAPPLIVCQGTMEIGEYMKAFLCEVDAHAGHNDYRFTTEDIDRLANASFYKLWFIHGLRRPVRDHILDLSRLPSFDEIVKLVNEFERLHIEKLA